MSAAASDDGQVQTELLSWPKLVPGTTELQLPLRARQALAAALAISPGVYEGSVRRVTSAGPFAQRLTLIAARADDEELCLTFVTDSGGAREFTCIADGWADDVAMIRFVADGGTEPAVVEWVTIVGVARNDVVRVGLITRAGEERNLTLNAWRGFSFNTREESDFPVALRAYGRDGSLIEEFPTLP